MKKKVFSFFFVLLTFISYLQANGRLAGETYQVLACTDRILRKNDINYWLIFDSVRDLVACKGISQYPQFVTIAIRENDLKKMMNLSEEFDNFGLELEKGYENCRYLVFFKKSFEEELHVNPTFPHVGILIAKREKDRYVLNSTKRFGWMQESWWSIEEIKSIHRTQFGPLWVNAVEDSMPYIEKRYPGIDLSKYVLSSYCWPQHLISEDLFLQVLEENNLDR
jgi:hypothetical protein